VSPPPIELRTPDFNVFNVTEPIISAGVSEELNDAIEERRRGDESKSATIKRLLRHGLERENPETDRVTARYIALVAGIVYVGGWALGGDATLSIAGGATIVGILVWSWMPELRRLYTD
jgi:hypothetical protein